MVEIIVSACCCLDAEWTQNLERQQEGNDSSCKVGTYIGKVSLYALDDGWRSDVTSPCQLMMERCALNV